MSNPDRPKQKNHKRYLFYRLYCVVIVLLWNIVGVHEMFIAETPGQYENITLFLVPFLIPAIFMVLNLSVFKFRYSVFGNLERTPPPSRPKVYSLPLSWGRIAWLWANIPLFSYRIYPSGLSVSIFGIGRAFLPFEFVEEIRPGFFIGSRFSHSNPEIRSPIILPGRGLSRAFTAHYDEFKTGHPPHQTP